jgi:acyl-[acyl-carrier-protein]-phospholipid O-acyltransferase/long-chain-fatty-acid--[acyl-carrier-protein] ligase
MSIRQLELLKAPRFFPIFAAQFLGAFNDNVFKNALVILITYRLGNSVRLDPQILVTFAAGLFILPFFLFSATAGQLADKYEKSQLIKIIKFFEIPLMILASLAFYLQSVYLLLSVLFFLGVQAAFFGPLKYSILPNLLCKDELLAGNGMIEAATFVSILLGTIFGGILVLLPYGEYLISISIVVISLLGFLVSLAIKNTHIQNMSLTINYNFFVETWRVIAYSKQRSDIYTSIIGISWFWLVGAVYLAEFPVFAKNILQADQYVVTMFIAIFSIGIAVGSLLCNALLKGKVSAKYVVPAALGMTVFAVDLYFSTKEIGLFVASSLMTPLQFLSMLSGWRISVDLFLIAVCGGLYTVPLYAILQQRSDESHRARVIASNNIINAMFMVFASIATILMLNLKFTVVDVFLTVAIVNAFVAIYLHKHLLH